jgi:hypothetical protein
VSRRPKEVDERNRDVWRRHRRGIAAIVGRSYFRKTVSARTAVDRFTARRAYLHRKQMFLSPRPNKPKEVSRRIWPEQRVLRAMEGLTYAPGKSR